MLGALPNLGFTILALGTYLATSLTAISGEPIATWTAAEESINEVAFSPNGRLLATADESGEIKFWDTGSHKLVRTLQSHRGRVGDDVIGGVQSVAFSPDSKSLASSGGDKKAKLWDVATGKQRQVLGVVEYAMSIAYSPDGGSIATVGSVNFKDTLCVFDAKTNAKVRLLQDSDNDSQAVVFSPDSKLIATAGKMGQVLLWDLKAGKLVKRMNKDANLNLTLALAFSPDGATLARGGDGPIRIFETKTGREIAQLEGFDGCLDLKLSADGKRLAASSRNGQVKVWDTASRRELATYEGHEDLVRTVAFSPDGKTIASGDKSGVVKIWSTPK